MGAGPRRSGSPRPTRAVGARPYKKKRRSDTNGASLLCLLSRRHPESHTQDAPNYDWQLMTLPDGRNYSKITLNSGFRPRFSVRGMPSTSRMTDWCSRWSVSAMFRLKRYQHRFRAILIDAPSATLTPSNISGEARHFSVEGERSRLKDFRVNQTEN